MKKTLIAMAAIVALAMSTMAAATTTDDVEPLDDAAFGEEYLAAPAVAGLLLEEAGIDNRYGGGRDGGNYIRDVGHNMGPETDFDGISKTDVALYQCAVADFLIDQGAAVYSGTGVIDPAASGATAVDNVDGTVTLAITVIDECGTPITDLTPTKDFSVSDSVIGGKFLFGTTTIPGSGEDKWSEDGGTYTVALERNFFNARPAGYNDGWFRIWDISVKGEVVEQDLTLQTTYWAVGDWKMDLTAGTNIFPRFIIIETHVDGDIDGVFGIGYDPDGAATGTITGSIDGQTIKMTYERTDIVTDYEADFEGNIADDGNSMSGTWSDNGTITDQPWSMTRS